MNAAVRTRLSKVGLIIGLFALSVVALVSHQFTSVIYTLADYFSDMAVTNVGQIKDAYNRVASTTGDNSSRQHSWSVARDGAALDRILPNVSKDDLIVDLGCCGIPWVTTYLEQAGYNVVGIDMPKSRWKDHSLNQELNLDLVAYDGMNIPLEDNSASLVLMFGVLEHVGVWKNSTQKYQQLNSSITSHRQTVLSEAARILEPNGTLSVTKFPNRYGLDKVYLLGGGHLNSERTRENEFRALLSEMFDVQEISRNGLLPYRLPWDSPSEDIAVMYTRFDGFLSSLPLFKEVAQSYCAIARPN
jgi:SAM-dependent methyltransferase